MAATGEAIAAAAVAFRCAATGLRSATFIRIDCVVVLATLGLSRGTTLVDSGTPKGEDDKAEGFVAEDIIFPVEEEEDAPPYADTPPAEALVMLLLLIFMDLA